jgi:hypothetical protein
MGAHALSGMHIIMNIKEKIFQPFITSNISNLIDHPTRYIVDSSQSDGKCFLL